METANSSAHGRMRAFDASFEFFLAPIRSLLDDPDISEIIINGPEQVWVERTGRLEPTSCQFASERSLRAAANTVAQSIGRRIDDDSPCLDGRLPDGSRVCIVLGNLTAGGTAINIRRFKKVCADPEFFLSQQSLTPEMLDCLKDAVSSHRNILVSGGTGSGKTTLLSMLCQFAEDRERLIVIEDTRELQIRKPHVVQMETRPADAFGRGAITVRDLFVTSLRMRPDRIIVGEVRRGEALDMIQALTSGHRGSMATLHASTPAEACGRLETMALMSDIGLPLSALRRQIASAIDVIVQCARLSDGSRRVTHISRVRFDDQSNSYLISDRFATLSHRSDRRAS